jgi:hypothetical protein
MYGNFRIGCKTAVNFGFPLSAPGTRNDVLRGRSRVVTNHPNQPAADKQCYRILHGATRQASRDSDPGVAGAHAAALGSARLRPEVQVNEKCPRPAVMCCKVAHEYIHYIVIQAQESSHAYILL